MPCVGQISDQSVIVGISLARSMAKVKIPSFKLNDGRSIPALGYGTWLGLDEKSEFKLQDAPQLIEALSYGIDIGYRHIDTAHLYRLEPEVGQVVREKVAAGIKREDVFVTTKVWHQHHREADVEVAARDSLRRLGLDYVDLLLVHWPMSISVDGVDEKIDYLETWRGMESVQRKGLAKSIGVSNFNVAQLKRLLANCTVKPVVNQVEINLNNGQNELVSYCQANDIVVVGYTTFGSMLRSDAPPDLQPKVDNPTLVAIANKYGKTVTQVTLRYLYQRGVVTIPKTLSKARVLQNASIFDFELDSDDVSTIAKFDNGYRTVVPAFWQDYENYPLDKIPDFTMKIPPSLMTWKNGINQDID